MTVVVAIIGLFVIISGSRSAETTSNAGSSDTTVRNASGPMSHVAAIHMPAGSRLQNRDRSDVRDPGNEVWKTPGFSALDVPIDQPLDGLEFCAAMDLGEEGAAGFYWSNHVEAIRIIAFPHGLVQIVRTSVQNLNGSLEELALRGCPS